MLREGECHRARSAAAVYGAPVAGHWALDVIISKTYNSIKRCERAMVKSG